MSFAQEPKPPMPVAAKTSGFAIASLVFGLLALFCVMPLIGSLLALVFGIVAIVKISGSEGRIKGGVMAGIGLAVDTAAAMHHRTVVAGHSGRPRSGSAEQVDGKHAQLRHGR